jgi:beta-galactosidase
MNLHRILFCILIFGASIHGIFPQGRTVLPFNDNWHFQGADVSGRQLDQTLTLPHTWNATDAQAGIPYYRGLGTYKKTFAYDPAWSGKRVYLRFEGVMSQARVWLNGELLGEHKGGYSAFVFELTAKLSPNAEHTIKVEADNSETQEILPLVGDFNLYGGIYRPVQLVVCEPIHISLTDFAGPGVYLKQTAVSAHEAQVEVLCKISSALPPSQPVELQYTLYEAAGQLAGEWVKNASLANPEQEIRQTIRIAQPRLWQGVEDPHLYRMEVTLVRNGRVLDRVTEPLGLRNYRVDPKEGFFLNGQHLPLHGVSRHQDRLDKGSAISGEDHREDVALIREMGANSVRLAHYQQARDIYHLCDSAGLVVWAEIPWVGFPDLAGGGTNGYEPTEEFRQNARQQLQELIRQNYNHPSICFWGIFNEIQNPKEASPLPLIQELQALAKEEDPTRLTTAASMLDAKENIHSETELIAWNKYFGWYYDDPEEIGVWLDETHEKHPEWSLGVSEYGAGGSLYQHNQDLSRPNPFGSPHPEEWQSYYHEVHLQAFNERPFVWGTYVWNMFDFGSHFRREGDQPGRNDKGLVSFDRQEKKDAFYFYKANWNEEPMLHLTSKRHTLRTKAKTPVKVYTNLPSVDLTVNGKLVGSQSPENGIVLWEDIALQKGVNQIEVTGKLKGLKFQENAAWVRESAFGLPVIFGYLQYIGPAILVSLLLSLWTWYKGFGRSHRRAKRWRRIMSQVFFVLFAIITVTLIVGRILLRDFL